MTRKQVDLDQPPPVALDRVPSRPRTASAAPALVTERLLVRRFRISDMANFTAYQAHPEVRRLLRGPAMDDEAAKAYVASQAALTGTELDAWHAWAVEHRTEHRVIGDVGVFVSAAKPHQGDVGFQFAPAHHRRGYATEAVGALCRHLLTVAGFTLLTASCDEENTGSRRVLEAVGMTERPPCAGPTRSFDLTAPGTRGTADAVPRSVR